MGHTKKNILKNASFIKLFMYIAKTKGSQPVVRVPLIVHEEASGGTQKGFHLQMITSASEF